MMALKGTIFVVALVLMLDLVSSRSHLQKLNGSHHIGNESGDADLSQDRQIGELDQHQPQFFQMIPQPCFPPESVVMTPSGVKRMDYLEVGDLVLDSNSEWTEVAAFFHAHQRGRSVYIRVVIDGSHMLFISPNHMIFRQKPNEPNVEEDVEASELQIGDILFLTNGTGRVTRLQSVVRRGAYAPLTLSGSLLVDGVWVSSFASLGPDGPKPWSQYMTQTYFMAPFHFIYRAAKLMGAEMLLRDVLFQPSDDGDILWYVRMWLLLT